MISHRVLDRSTVTLDLPGLDTSQPASSAVRAVFPRGRRQEFTAGSLELGLQMATLLGLELREEYALQGGRLRVGSGSVFDRDIGLERHAIGVWEGDSSSIYTVLYGNVDASDFIELFNLFVVRQEEASAPSFIPRRPRETPFEDSPTLLKQIPQLGLLQVRQLTMRTARHLPSWPGTRVRGGELFVSRPGRLEGYFTLVGDSSVAIISPESTCNSDYGVTRVAQIQTSWTPPPD